MFVRKNIAVIIILIAILSALPVAFAGENQTVIASDAQDNLTSDYYFDADIENDSGDGSFYKPYKYFNEGNLHEDSVHHLSEGVYESEMYASVGNITIIGENTYTTIVNDMELDSSKSLILHNLTAVNCHFTNTNYFAAYNVIFKDTYSKTGGAITSADSNVLLVNCTFENIYAYDYGGVIQTSNSNLTVKDSCFENNYAKNWGGAIACEDKSNLTVTDTTFYNNYAKNDAGGAIYLKDSNMIAENVNISSSSSTFGGAIAAVHSNLNITNLNSKNNKAKYEGGSVYLIYGDFICSKSLFDNNSARNGGAVFIDNAYTLYIHSTNFINNNAENTGGAYYSILPETDSILDTSLKNTFSNNNASIENDAYECAPINLTVFSGDYSLLKYNPSYNGTLPDSYDLRTLGQVTSVKAQGSGGNCWSFAASGALESAILKANGTYYDLSEENMKNVMAMYSAYGWAMEPNAGGFDDMAVGYLTSWLGPVLESEDAYSPSSILSPVLSGFIHVQNIVFLERSNYTDNDAIKKAIMDYGGVSTSIAWYGGYLTGKNYYFNGSLGANHAVIIVGWDDNYNRSNFKKTPQGDGAWIIKNSWGTSSGEKGYYYVSYYDTRLAPISKSKAIYAFVFNDTMKYDKNYQYDIPGRTDYFINSSKTVWYKNRFKSTDDEYLAAVSTYFEKETSWTLSVYVNNALKLTQNGKSGASYKTIELDKMISLKKGDEFEIVFKIVTDSEAGVPVSEVISLNSEFYTRNISYISYDGKNWKDFYNLTWSYSSHAYYSQVACIKAFTILNPVNTEIFMNITDKGCCVDIEISVYNEYGYLVKSGNLTFNSQNAVSLVNGVYRFSNVKLTDGINKFTASFNSAGYNSSSKTVLFNKVPLDTYIVLNQSGLDSNPVQITASVFDVNNNLVGCGKVTFTVEGKNYTVDIADGVAILNHHFEKGGLTTVKAYYDDTYCYSSSEAENTFNITLIETQIDVSFDNSYNPLLITVNVRDNNGNPVKSGSVYVLLDGNEYTKVLDNGQAVFEYVFTKTGQKTINVKYKDETRYDSSEVNETAYIKMIPTAVTLEFKDNHNPSQITAYVNDGKGNAVNEGSVSFMMDGKNYDVDVVNGIAQINHTFTIEGVNKVLASYSGSDIYSESTKYGTVNISKIMLNISMDISQYLNDLTVNVRISQDINEHIVLYCDDEQFTVKSKNGIALFDLSDLKVGNHIIKAKISSYIYDCSEISDSVYVGDFKSSINSQDIVCYYNQSIKYSVKLVNYISEAVSNAEIIIKTNGKTFTALTDANGIAYFTLNLKTGVNELAITFKGNDFYLSSAAVSYVTVKSTAEITTSSVYTYNSDFKARLLDSSGKALANAEATISVNGLTYSVKTDSNGDFTYNFRMSPGTYTVKVTNIATDEVVTQSIKVVKRITGNNALTMYYGAGSSYKVKVLDDYGNVAKNVKVSFKLNGKTYWRYTNSAGYASIKISLNPGTYTVKATYKGYSVSNKIKVKSTIVTKNLSVKKGKTIKFTVKLLSSKGKILKYKKVTVKFKGKTYKIKTNKKGIATLKITKKYAAGKYTIKTSYGKLTVKNKITVKK